jgi:hypothetical protein
LPLEASECSSLECIFKKGEKHARKRPILMTFQVIRTNREHILEEESKKPRKLERTGDVLYPTMD